MDKHVLFLGMQMRQGGHGGAKVTERCRGGKTALHGQGHGAVVRQREMNCEGLAAGGGGAAHKAQPARH